MVEFETVYDAIVIGSGAAGSWAAKDLTEGGLRVLLLEAGRNIDIARDFPAGKSTTNLGTLERIRLAVLGQHIQVKCGVLSELSKQFFVNDRQNPLYDTKEQTVHLDKRPTVGGPASHLGKTCAAHVEL